MRLRIAALWQAAQDPEGRRVLHLVQFASSLLFVILYVWSTYSTPAPFSLRALMDLMLCGVFAVEYAIRYAVSSR